MNIGYGHNIGTNVGCGIIVVVFVGRSDIRYRRLLGTKSAAATTNHCALLSLKVVSPRLSMLFNVGNTDVVPCNATKLDDICKQKKNARSRAADIVVILTIRCIAKSLKMAPRCSGLNLSTDLSVLKCFCHIQTKSSLNRTILFKQIKFGESCLTFPYQS